MWHFLYDSFLTPVDRKCPNGERKESFSILKALMKPQKIGILSISTLFS